MLLNCSQPSIFSYFSVPFFLWSLNVEESRRKWMTVQNKKHKGVGAGSEKNRFHFLCKIPAPTPSCCAPTLTWLAVSCIFFCIEKQWGCEQLTELWSVSTDDKWILSRSLRLTFHGISSSCPTERGISYQKNTESSLPFPWTLLGRFQNKMVHKNLLLMPV